MIIKNAEILCVGTEILIGDIVNTNSAFISQKLCEMGINQYRQTAVGDNPERLADAINEALSRTDLLIMTGGLGPTYDDLTKEVAAKCMGRELVFDEEAYENIKNLFTFRCRQMTKNNEKQAYVPTGSTVFHNDSGTAPGIAIEDFEKGKIIIMLPGVPFEMKRMFDVSVMPYLSKYIEKQFYSINVNIFGLGESAVEDALSELMKNSLNPTVAPYCGDGEVRLRVTARADTREECKALCLEAVEKIKNSDVGEFVYGFDTNLETAVCRLLAENKMTVATAESCTGGLISKRITEVAGSSEVFGYGVVTYANEAKMNLLGVKSETLEAFGAVSYQTAEEMAEGVRKLSGADIGVAVTGIAGPGGGTPEKPVGLVYVGISSRLGVRHVKLMLKGDRNRVRILTSANALSEIRKEVITIIN